MATVDENLYSRQLGVYGHEAMGKLVKMEVLIVGLRGLGVETAKNLILAGPKSVTLFDPEPTTHADLGCNYYLTAANVGKPRAASCVEALAELNPYVSVTALDAPALSEAILDKFHCVIVTDCVPLPDLVRFSTYCHTHQPAPIGFISAGVRGVAGYAFVDFGPDHVIRDPNGEQTRSAIVTEIAVTDPHAGGPSDTPFLTVFTHDAKRHGFDEGDHVVFKEVEGLTAVNDGRARRITSTKPFCFTLAPLPGEDVSSYAATPYTAGGIVEQTKVPVHVAFAPLAERIPCPVPKDDPSGALVTPDWGKFGRSEQLHVAFNGLEAYRARHGRYPSLRNASEAAEVLALAKEFAAGCRGKTGALQVEEVEEAVVMGVAMLAKAELPALAAFFGGVVAQEAVKLTGKFTPLRQWLYLDAFDVLPKDWQAQPDDEWVPAGNRYDNVTGIFGRSLQTKIAAQRVFVVGSGALGCEFLKNYAMMGVGCGAGGQITVTDMDRIEVSNLNRQFLFRQWNVGNPKSVTAAAAARAMNPDFNVEALEIPVGDDTETTFTDTFWERLDFVTNALDNLKARGYVDNRCVFYAKPLLESGTLGTKANTQIIIPHETETYTDSQDPPEESIPMCTLRNFPHAIEHCIEWARDLFAGSFTNTMQDAAAFATSPSDWLRLASDEQNLAARRSKLEGVLAVVKSARAASWEACLEEAANIFHTQYYLNIRKLLHQFPVDYVDSNGIKFWSGPKRAPLATPFDPSDAMHYAFAVHAACLFAANYGVSPPAGFDAPDALAGTLAAIAARLPPYVPKETRIKTDERDTTTEGAEDDGQAVAVASAALSAVAAEQGVLAGLRLTAADFEKDDDANHHIDFITQAANLRARNYKIKEATRYEVKMTAGKIIPAIATTTCMVTGLVCLEAYKVIQGKPVDLIRNSFVNLAINNYVMGETAPAKKTKSVEFDVLACGPIRAQPEGFTRWDRIVIRDAGSMTPVQLEQWFEREQKLSINMVTSGKTILYNPLLFRNHKAQRGDKPLRRIYEDSTNAPITKAYMLLDVSAADDESDVLVPQVQLYF